MTSLTKAEIGEIVSEALAIAMTSCSNLKVTTYDGTIGYKAVEFIDDFDLYAKTKSWTDQTKFELFEGYLTDHAKKWYKLTVTKSASPPTDWKTLKQSFLDYHLPKDKNRYFKEQLNKRRQGKEEPVSHYIVSKHLLCLNVNPHMSEKEILLYILEGLIPELQRELYLKDFKNLQEMKELAVRIETALKFDNVSNYENDNMSGGSIETLLDRLNLLLNKVEDNSNQLNNMSENENYNNDRSQNSFSNNVSRYFSRSNYFDHYFNSIQNYSYNFLQNNSNNFDTTHVDCNSIRENPRNINQNELRCFNVKKDIDREPGISNEPVCNCLSLRVKESISRVNDELKFSSRTKDLEITESFNDSVDKNASSSLVGKDAFESLIEKDSDTFDDENNSCELNNEQFINKIVEVINDLVIKNNENSVNQEFLCNLNDEKVSNESSIKVNIVESSHRNYEINSEQRKNESIEVKNEILDLINEFQIDEYECDHKQNHNELILHNESINEADIPKINFEAVIAEITEDSIEISSVKDSYVSEKEVNAMIANNDTLKYPELKSEELVNEIFINENSCRIEIVECFDINGSFTEKGSKERFHEFNLEIGFKTNYSIENKYFANNCLSFKEYLEGNRKVKLFKNAFILFYLSSLF
jgi:hypothetical protein